MKPTLGNGSTRMKLDLSHYSTCLRPAGRSVEETLVAHHRPVARSSYRTREQFFDTSFQNLLRPCRWRFNQDHREATQCGARRDTFTPPRPAGTSEIRVGRVAGSPPTNRA